MAFFHLGLDVDSWSCMKRVLMLRPQSGFAHQWLASIDALHDEARSSEGHLAAFCRQVPGHTVDCSARPSDRTMPLSCCNAIASTMGCNEPV